ncbi:hypothetical protein ACS0TY_024781 [Phlomoides rotata]
MMSQSEIAALKDALSAQQRLLQKLYNELEAEREASATAASEALSVILRLQGEKAAVKMEAEQYKRLAEEKMIHAEESFAVIEDIITEKEMEKADLEYQLQTYKYELMSYGLIEPDDDDVKIPDNIMNRRVGGARFVRRNSAPLLIKYKKAMVDGESREVDFGPNNVDDNEGVEMHGELERKANSCAYADQIRELELRIIEIAGVNYASPSLSSQPSVGNLQEMRSPSPELNVVNSKKNNDYPISSSSVHDVFEVPQADVESRCYEPTDNGAKEMRFEDLKRKDRVPTEAVKSYAKDEPAWLKKLLHSTNNEKNLCKPSHIAAIDRAVGTSLSESLNRGNGSSEITEVEELVRKDEEMMLLKEIREKLNLLQNEIRLRKVKEPSVRDDKPSLRPLYEAMAYFWL